jgi:flagellum-specific peptidoglycan hydrolase FlgJ
MYGKATYNRMKSFIDKYGYGIAKSITNTGLYFPMVTAQSAYESGYGERIPDGSNNFGGIKYNPNLKGVIGYVEVDTSEYIGGKKVMVKQKFAKFKDVESGFNAHIQVLMADRYRNARMNAKSPEEQLKMVAQAGYTTTPPDTYLSQIKSMIEASRDYSKIGRIV